MRAIAPVSSAVSAPTASNWRPLPSRWSTPTDPAGLAPLPIRHVLQVPSGGKNLHVRPLSSVDPPARHVERRGFLGSGLPGPVTADGLCAGRRAPLLRYPAAEPG